MAQPSREREETILKLEQLTPLRKGPESNSEDTKNTHSKFNHVPNSRPEDILGVEAVEAAQVDKIGESKIKVDMLQAQ